MTDLDSLIGLLLSLRQDALDAIEIIETNDEIGSWLLDPEQWHATADQIDETLARLEHGDITSFPLPMQNFLENPECEVQETAASMAELSRRIEVIETTVKEIRELLANPTPMRDWYSIAEVASMLSRAEFTVREWARLGRIYASKRACGRGPTQEWIISAEEVERIRNEGLLPQ